MSLLGTPPQEMQQLQGLAPGPPPTPAGERSGLGPASPLLAETRQTSSLL